MRAECRSTPSYAPGSSGCAAPLRDRLHLDPVRAAERVTYAPAYWLTTSSPDPAASIADRSTSSRRSALPPTSVLHGQLPQLPALDRIRRPSLEWGNPKPSRPTTRYRRTVRLMASATPRSGFSAEEINGSSIGSATVALTSPCAMETCASRRISTTTKPTVDRALDLARRLIRRKLGSASPARRRKGCAGRGRPRRTAPAAYNAPLPHLGAWQHDLAGSDPGSGADADWADDHVARALGGLARLVVPART